MKRMIVTSVLIGVVLLAGGLVIRLGFGGSGRPISLDRLSDPVESDVPMVSSDEVGEPRTMPEVPRTMSEAVAAAAGGNWGLSFQTEGEAPVANATAEYLKQFNSWYIGPEAAQQDRCIYLTFDAGYENGCTEEILDVLQEEKVPAAFFLVGNYIEENPDLVKRMAAEGHTVGNHTMHHPDMSAISAKEDFEKELDQLEAVHKEVTGEDMKKFYRPPQGKYSEENLSQAAELGYTTVFWSLAYVDWLEDKQPTREDALNILNKRIHPGAIVLLHSTSKTNCEILSELIKGWKEQGYEFRSITEAILRSPWRS